MIRSARVATLAALVLASFAARADAKGPGAGAIIKQMIDADPLGYGGAEAEVFMVLVNKRNQQRRRKLVTRTRNDDGTRRTYVRFTEPTDIAGTAFLGISRGDDRQQHLYMPALGKVRRISASSRNSRFVGSDYTYADMDYRDIENAAKKRTGEEKIGGQPCWVVEVTPRSDDSQYGKVTLWVAQKTNLPLRMRFFDKSGREIKRYFAKEIQKKRDRYIITESKLVDLKRKHTTVLKAIRVKLRSDIPLEQFTVRALDRE